jgi:hypothetical protein
MYRSAATATAKPGPAGSRWRAIPAAIVVSGFVLLAVGCSGGPAQPDPKPTSSARGRPAESGPGGSGQVSSQNRGGNQGTQTSGSYSVAFARCMRAHGIPDFPDPNGSSGQLGPASGIDPTSPEFQTALNGPCKSLAPPGWLGSGKVTAPGGSS